MSRYFQIGELFFFPQKNEIHREAEIRKVRPKTAELLTVLLKANGDIVNKSELLKLVWNDVIVEEHVVFQSIAELRKIFADNSMIKTHPRKGYSITATIKEHIEQEVVATKPVADVVKRRSLWGACIGVFMIVLGGLYSAMDDHQSLDASGSIVVLPVKNHIADADHSWLKYGGMDLLIKHLMPQMELAVLHTEDVLEILKRANVDADVLDSDAVSRIFEVSGAKLIIEQSLSGSTRDYQLVYSFYQREQTKRGALFSESVESLFVELNTRIQAFAGGKKASKDFAYQNDFANELIAKATDQLQDKNPDKAATLLKAVLVTEPNNLTAYKLLSQILSNSGQFKEAEKVSAEGMLVAAKNSNEVELARIMFWNALSIAQLNKTERALVILEEAKEKAKAVNDLLYIANISRVSGRIHLSQQRYIAAETEFMEALASHTAIQCPFGRSNTLIDLGELAYEAQDVNKAANYFNEALVLAQTRHLGNTVKLAQHWLDKI